MDRPGSAALREGGDGSPRRSSRPNSLLSASQLSGEYAEAYTPPTRPVSQSIATQTVATGDLPAPPEPAPEPKVETLTYSKGVQTDAWTELRSRSEGGGSDSEGEDGQRSNKRMSRRERERDEEIRESLRKEIEAELQATDKAGEDEDALKAQLRYPLRTLTSDELNAVTSSDDFLDFVEKSSKVIERALDEEYDVLADYALGGAGPDNEEDEEYWGKKQREIKEVAQFWDEKWSKKRMISDISFSPKVRSSISHFKIPIANMSSHCSFQS